MFKNLHLPFSNDVEPFRSISIPENKLIRCEATIDSQGSQLGEFVIIQAGENRRILYYLGLITVLQQNNFP